MKYFQFTNIFPNNIFERHVKYELAKLQIHTPAVDGLFIRNGVCVAGTGNDDPKKFINLHARTLNGIPLETIEITHDEFLQFKPAVS